MFFFPFYLLHLFIGTYNPLTLRSHLFKTIISYLFPSSISDLSFKVTKTQTYFSRIPKRYYHIAK